jgi:hypothetical protein
MIDTEQNTVETGGSDLCPSECFVSRLVGSGNISNPCFFNIQNYMLVRQFFLFDSFFAFPCLLFIYINMFLL